MSEAKAPQHRTSGCENHSDAGVLDHLQQTLNTSLGSRDVCYNFVHITMGPRVTPGTSFAPSSPCFYEDSRPAAVRDDCNRRSRRPAPNEFEKPALRPSAPLPIHAPVDHLQKSLSDRSSFSERREWHRHQPEESRWIRLDCRNAGVTCPGQRYIH